MKINLLLAYTLLRGITCEATSDNPDMESYADLSTLPDMEDKPCSRRISPGCPIGVGVCTQNETCSSCGQINNYCCASNANDAYCLGSGLTCSKQSGTSWGLFTRCQDDRCGVMGRGCCYQWLPYGLNETCLPGQGMCNNHICIP